MLSPLWPAPPEATLAYIVWYFFPAMLLNLVLYLAAGVFGEKAQLPLDLGYSSRRERWVGDGRGFSSFLWGLGVVAFCAVFQGREGEMISLVAGAQMGMIALSVIKRQRGLPRGTPFRPWEHLDFVLGAVLFQLSEGRMPVGLAVAGLLVCGLVHWLLGGAIKSVVRLVVGVRKVGSRGDKNLER